MDKIYTNKDFKKKMVESALNGEVKESHDQNGKYFEITNLNDFEYESNGVKRDIYAGAKFRVYNKTEKISLLREFPSGELPVLHGHPEFPGYGAKR